MGYKILVTGTPAVGKTSLSQYMKRLLGCKHIELSDLIVRKKLYTNKCDIYDTLEYNIDSVREYLNKKIKEKSNYIIDTHDPESVESIKFDVIIVLMADPGILYERYLSRSYNDIKIQDNMQVEIMEVIYNDVIENLCENEEDAEKIIKIETVHNKKIKPLEDIYKEIIESPHWPDSIKTGIE